MRKYPLYLILVLAIPVQAGIAPNKIDPSLAIVSHGFGFRVLVYSICSPEHCWSETHLQNVSFGTENPKIICSTKVNEIAYGHVIKNVNWALVGNAPIASLSAEASHGGFEPRNITISLTESVSMKFRALLPLVFNKWLKTTPALSRLRVLANR